jgi:hypothetical protein
MVASGSVEPTPRRERWNIGFQMDISHFNWILTILILSSILPVAGTLNQHCIILSEPQARTHYSTIPLFHHSLRGVGATLRAGGQL